MLSEASQRLADDHAALDEVMRQLQAALESGDIGSSHSLLDLFWARLAVHIRCEHLHVFPAVINALVNQQADNAEELSLSEGNLAVEQLRADHDFFMHELAEAIRILRDLMNATDQSLVDEGVKTVRGSVLQIERRLALHNEAEENKLYRWASKILTEQEQAVLAKRINAELANRPSRFSLDTWSNQ